MSTRILTLFVAALAATIVLAQGGFDREATAKPWGQAAAKQAKKAAKAAAASATEEEAERRSAGGEDGVPKEATLTIDGEPGTEFSGSCAVGDEKDDLGGEVPQRISYRFVGEELECKIRQRSAGALKVVLDSGDDRSEQRMNSRGAS